MKSLNCLRSIVFLAVFVLCPGLGRSAPLTIADSIADWSTNPGVPVNGWSYGYYDQSLDADGTYAGGSDFTPFPHDGGGHSPTDFWSGSGWDWFNGNPPWTELGQETTHPAAPNGSAVNPNNPATHIHWTVRRWNATVDANLKARVRFRKTNVCCGDGVRVSLFHNSVQVYSQAIAGTDGVGRDDTIELPGVFVGDNIDLLLGPGDSANDGADASAFSVVYFEGEPSIPAPPVITAQPTNYITYVGGAASFGVTATGAAPLRYQWRFNITNTLVNATNATVALSNVQAAAAGAYQVVITNTVGAVTSTVANLLVNPADDRDGDGMQDAWEVAHFGGLAGGEPLADLDGDGMTNVEEYRADTDPVDANSYLSVASLALVGGGFPQVTMSTRPGLTYGVEYSNALEDPTWSLMSQTVATGSSAVVSDSGPLPSRRFYRAWAQRALDVPRAYSVNMVGFANVRAVPGSNWLAVPFFALPSTVGSLFPNPPEGTCIVRAGDPFGTCFFEGAWDSPGTSLARGVPFEFHNPLGTELTLTFIGEVGGKPVVISQPAGATSTVGGTATFQVASVGAPPLRQQWFFQQTNLLAGATNGVLSLTNLQLAHAGGYSVVVSNSSGSVTSALAILSLMPSAGFVWNRFTDYRAGVTHGSTNGNPHVDQLGQPTWRYSWLNQNLATGQTPWYGITPTLMVWSSAWFGRPELARWQRGNNIGPIVSQTYLQQANLNNTQQQYAPLVEWENLTGRDVVVNVTGPAQVGWTFRPSPGRIEVVVARRSAVSGDVAPLFRQELAKPTADTSPEFVSFQIALNQIRLSPRDRLLFAMRKMDNLISDENTELYDEMVSIILQPSGTPTILVNGQFPAGVTVTNAAVVTLQTSFTNGPVFYTLNGAHPGGGTLYSGPIVVSTSVAVRVIAYNADFSESAESDAVTLTVVHSPFITQHPVTQTVLTGQGVVLSAQASGDAPLAYQWYFNGSAIGGATSSSFVRDGAVLSHAGAYWVVASNPYGSATSAVAGLTVLLRPSVLAQPAGTNVNSGQSATFCVSAIGSAPLVFQWRKNGVNIPGATNSCYAIPNVQATNAGAYSVVVGNGADAITSAEAVLVLADLPNGPPAEDDFAIRNRLFGNSGSLEVNNVGATKEPGEPDHAGKAGGASVWYRWTPESAGIATLRTSGSAFDTLLAVYRGNEVAALTPVAANEDGGGFLTSAVSFNATNGVEYQIAVDGFAAAQGSFILSWNLEPTAQSLPVISVPPVSQTVTPGATATFSVSAAGSGLRYQWHFNGAHLNHATNTSFTRTNVQPADVGYYAVAVTNDQGRGLFSEAGVLEIGPFAEVRSVDKVEDLLGGPQPFQPASAGFASVAIGTLGTQVLNTTNSTTSFRETNHCGVIGGSSRWFKLKPAANGLMAIDTFGSTFDTVLAAYTGNPQLGGYPTKLIDCDDNAAADARWSRVLYAATNAMEYLIAVDGAGAASGTVQLNWSLGLPPVIVSNPPAGTPLVGEGDPLQLITALTNGLPPPKLQWYLNGAPIPDATNAIYDVSAAQRGSGGAYTVVASNPVGAVTSLVANVTVEVPLRLNLQPVVENGKVHVRVSGVASQTFILQGTTNFANWQPLYTNTAAGAPVSFDDRSTTNRARRYYRALPWP